MMTQEHDATRSDASASEDDRLDPAPESTDDEELDPRVVELRSMRVAQGLPADPSPALLAALYEVMRPPRVEAIRQRAQRANEARRFGPETTEELRARRAEAQPPASP